MAGSYNHIVDEQGRLIGPMEMAQMLDTGGDVYETIREMFGMIWYLAEESTDGFNSPAAVEAAERNYKEGLALSPGTSEGN